MTLLLLFAEFFKTGLFAVGGGMATVPFLFELIHYGWYTKSELLDMIAVGESTPGPIGVNMATFAGFRAGGIAGGIAATLGLVLPSVIVVILVYKALEKFKNNPLTENAFYALRPAVAGLVIAACAELFRETVLQKELVFSDLSGIFQPIPTVLFVLLTVLVFWFKKLHPIVIIAIGAAAGILFRL